MRSRRSTSADKVFATHTSGDSPWPGERSAAAYPYPTAGELEQRGSLVGLRYRWTTPEMEGRVVAAIEQRLAVALTVAEGHKVM
jgi:hypothetical protein